MEPLTAHDIGHLLDPNRVITTPKEKKANGENARRWLSYRKIESSGWIKLPDSNGLTRTVAVWDGEIIRPLVEAWMLSRQRPTVP